MSRQNRIVKGGEYQLEEIKTGANSKGEWQLGKTKESRFSLFFKPMIKNLNKGDFVQIDEITETAVSYSMKQNVNDPSRNARFVNYSVTCVAHKTKDGFLDDIDGFENLEDTGLTGELPF